MGNKDDGGGGHRGKGGSVVLVVVAPEISGGRHWTGQYLPINCASCVVDVQTQEGEGE